MTDVIDAIMNDVKRASKTHVDQEELEKYLRTNMFEEKLEALHVQLCDEFGGRLPAHIVASLEKQFRGIFIDGYRTALIEIGKATCRAMEALPKE
jgi:hypothetical protein